MISNRTSRCNSELIGTTVIWLPPIFERKWARCCTNDRWIHTKRSEDIKENFLFIAASEWVSVANAFDKQINIVWCASFVTHFESYNLAWNIPFETFRLHFVACLVFGSGIFVTFPIPFNKLIGCCLHLPLQYGHRWLVGQSICSAQYVAQNLCPSKLTYLMYEIRPKLLVLVQRSHILGQKLYRSYFEATFYQIENDTKIS